jgi:hypothetical protein
LALYWAVDANRCRMLLVRGEGTFMDEEVFHPSFEEDFRLAAS